jgi:hypothetical protein
MIILAQTRLAKKIGATQPPVYFRGLSGGRSTPLQSAELLRQAGLASPDTQSKLALTQ